MTTAEVVQHPLVQHKLTLLRRSKTSTAEFRRLVAEIGSLLAYEACRGLELETVTIQTPMGAMSSPLLTSKKLCLISIMRAGNGLLDGMLQVIPAARVGYVGLYREPRTLEVVEYYCKLPRDIAQRDAIVVDPMVATGHTAVAALNRIKDAGATGLTLVCLLAAPEGLAALASAHPDVRVITAAIDQRLDEHGYILPGLGDAGDRMYGTR